MNPFNGTNGSSTSTLEVNIQLAAATQPAAAQDDQQVLLRSGRSCRGSPPAQASSSSFGASAPNSSRAPRASPRGSPRWGADAPSSFSRQSRTASAAAPSPTFSQASPSTPSHTSPEDDPPPAAGPSRGTQSSRHSPGSARRPEPSTSQRTFVQPVDHPPPRLLPREDAGLMPEELEVLREFHSRAFHRLDSPVLMVQAAVLKQSRHFRQPPVYARLLFPCLYNEYHRVYVQTRNPLQQPSQHSYVRHEPEEVPLVPSRTSGFCSNFSRFLFHVCCLQCTLSQQATLMTREREKRRVVPHEFCCDWILGAADRGYTKGLATTLCLDILTCGYPWCMCCCCGYRGMGSLVFGWRLRYLIRCRYGIAGSSVGDIAVMGCCAPFGADQLCTQLSFHGIDESRDWASAICCQMT